MGTCNNKKFRRGVSLLDVVISIAVVTLLSSIVVTSTSFAFQQMNAMKRYTDMKIYVVDLLGRIETDLEAHASNPASAPVINAIDYDDDGKTANAHGDESGIEADVTITDLGGDVVGKQAYLVHYELKDVVSEVSLSGNALVREGSSINVP